VSLAAMQFQAKFGAYNAASHRPGFLSKLIVEYVPTDHLNTAGKTVEAWETMIFHKLAYSTTATPRESYLDFLKKRDYYGSTFFVVRQRFDRNLPKTLFLAVSRRGILLLRLPKATADGGELENIASFKLADVYRWAYKPGINFYFEVKLDAGGSPGNLGFEANPVRAGRAAGPPATALARTPRPPPPPPPGLHL